MMNGYHNEANGLPFVTTTLKLIAQYEQFSKILPKEERLETTLLVNCLLGLLIIPQQYQGSEAVIQITPEHDEQDWGIKLSAIRYCCQQSSCKAESRNTANEVARHLRNAIVHKNRFEIISEDGINITHILFKDFARTTQQSFEYKFEISALTKFVRKFYGTVYPHSFSNAS